MSTENTRIIKKYPNRRLYDTEKCSYITLSDIKQYVLDHLDFRVIDAQTEADLTKTTLFQVLTEHEAAENTFFTTELLQQMIRLYQEDMQSIFGRYFEQALMQFIKQKEVWSQHFEQYQANPLTPLNEFTKMQSQFFETLLQKSKNK